MTFLALRHRQRSYGGGWLGGDGATAKSARPDRRSGSIRVSECHLEATGESERQSTAGDDGSEVGLLPDEKAKKCGLSFLYPPLKFRYTAMHS